MDKKGIVMTMVLSLILALISAVVLFGVLAFWKEDAEAKVRYSICGWSAVIKDKLKIAGKDLGYELRCTPARVEVDAEKEDVNEIIVENMYRCWRSLGKGKLDIISSWGFFKKKVACVICAEIMPKGIADENVIEVSLEQINDAANNYELPDEDKTFVNYFVGKDENIDFRFGNGGNLNAKRSEPLYVTYSFYKLRGDAINLEGFEVVGAGVLGTTVIASRSKATSFLLKKVGARALGGIVGIGLIGAEVAHRDDLRQGIMIMSGKQINGVCDELK